MSAIQLFDLNGEQRFTGTSVGGGGSLPAEWTVGADGELEIASPVPSGATVKVFRIVDPGNPDTDIAITLADDSPSPGDESIIVSLAPSADGTVSLVLVDDNSDGTVSLRTDSTNLISIRTGTTGPLLKVQVGSQIVFEVDADGSLHGKTGASLVFDR